MPHPLDTETLAQGAARIEHDARSWSRAISDGREVTMSDIRAVLALIEHLAAIAKKLCEKIDN